MGHSNRSPNTAADWYHEAAMLDHPEALVAEAMLEFLHLHNDGSAQANTPIPQDKCTMNNKIFRQMIKNLERAAILGHCCPHMVVFTETFLKAGYDESVKLPHALKVMYRKHQEDASDEYRNEKRDRKLQCALAGCEISSNLKYCGKCKQIAYCGRDHQLEDYSRHKKECKHLMKMGDGLAFRSSDRVVQKAMSIIQGGVSNLDMNSK